MKYLLDILLEVPHTTLTSVPLDEQINSFGSNLYVCIFESTSFLCLTKFVSSCMRLESGENRPEDPSTFARSDSSLR